MTSGELVLLALRLLLTLTFLVAGAAKIAAPRRSMRMLHDFGVPSAMQWLGALLAPAELLVALGLVVGVTAPAAAWSAIALLVLFILGISANLLRGRAPDCNCFGQVHAAPIRWTTLVRNGLLVACAGALVVRPESLSNNAWAAFSGLTGTEQRVATVLAAVFVFALLSTARSESRDPDAAAGGWEEDGLLGPERPRVRPRPPVPAATATPSPDRGEAHEVLSHSPSLSGLGLAVGAAAPQFTATDFDGGHHSLASLLAPGAPLAVVFSTPGCPSCQWLLPRLPGLAAAIAPVLRLVLVTRGTREQNAEKLKATGALLVLRQEQFEVSEAFNCTTTPSAVIVAADGRVDSALAEGGLAIETLIAATADHLRARPVIDTPDEDRDGLT